MNSLAKGNSNHHNVLTKHSRLNKSGSGVRVKSRVLRLEKSNKKSRVDRVSSLSSFLHQNPETAQSIYPYSTGPNSEF